MQRAASRDRALIGGALKLSARASGRTTGRAGLQGAPDPSGQKGQGHSCPAQPVQAARLFT